MKIKKTVELSIDDAWDDFCDKHLTCSECPLCRGKNEDCLDWCKSHPHEAASIMRCEVVEEADDYRGSDEFPFDPTEKHPDDTTEENDADDVGKPRICEILGLDVGEEFCIKGLDRVTYRILEDGTFATKPKNAVGSAKALLKTLDHPELVVRIPDLTPEEVERAKAVKVLFPEVVRLERRVNGVGGMDKDGLHKFLFSEDMFPNIEMFKSYTIEEITGGAG